MEGNNRYYSSQNRGNQKNQPDRYRAGDYRNRDEYVNPPADRSSSRKWTSNYPTSDENSGFEGDYRSDSHAHTRDYSTQGEDRWPGDPARMNRAQQGQSDNEIWSRGSNYITPSKWQERSREPRARYFNNYQSDRSEMEARGEHAGRGPKGYQRSDERIREEVCEALLHDKWVNASDIEVEVKSGIVTLKGSVEDRRMKREAEDCAAQSASVKDVRNELTVGSASTYTPPTQEANKSGKKERTDDSVTRSMN